MNTERTAALPAAWVILRILIPLNWILGAGILGLLTATYTAEAWTWRALGVGAFASDPAVVVGMRAIMVIGLVGVPITSLVLTRLLRIVGSVRVGEPFIVENAERLKTIGWAVLGLELLRVVVGRIAHRLAVIGLPTRFDDQIIPAWLAVLLLFVLAQVFREGVRMREDLEGTV